MKIVYDEWYGKLSFAQRAAYRKFNVPPAHHAQLVDAFGADAHVKITNYVKRHSTNGYYQPPWPFDPEA